MLKSYVKQAIRHFGFELLPYLPDTSRTAHLMRMLSTHNVNLVLDVGANIGQFGRSLREAGYRGRIVSFEPLLSAREQLLSASRNDSIWEVAPRAAIGNENGEIDLHVAGNSVSSSALEMHERHARSAPESRYVGTEHVPLRRLDSMATEYLRPDSVTMLKIDTQGYEDRVLRGASGMMDRIVGLQVELSLVPLYEGQLLFENLLEQVKSAGFELWGLWPEFTDPQSGRLLQVDATFFRP
jgi:FkbM family methyltransferase